MKFLPFVLSALAALAIGGVVVTSQAHNASAGDQNQYKVAPAQLGPVKKTVSATGTLQPLTTVDIKSKAGGRVNALLVDVGSVVKPNQIIARIDPSDTILSVNTAQADIEGARAHTLQSQETYELQLQQSKIAVENAQAAVTAAIAARDSAEAQALSADEQAAAQPEQTGAAIAQAQANYDAAVKDRQTLDATNPQDHAAAKAAYDQAIANQKSAKAALARQVTLAKLGYVAQQNVDTAQATYDVDAAAVETAYEKLQTIDSQQAANNQSADAKIAQAKAALQSAEAGKVDVATRRAAARQAQAQLASADAQLQEAKVALAQAQANLANNAIRQQDVVYNTSVIKSNQASLTNAETTLQQTVVRSPVDGVVLVKDVSQGTYITSGESLNSVGSTIVTVGNVHRMYVLATVDETDLANVRLGQSVDAVFDAYPGTTFKGKVTLIEPQAVVVQNVTQYNVHVEIDNTSPSFSLLKPGMNATCNFLVASKDNTLTVQSSAIQVDDQGPYVLIAKGGTPAPADPASGTPADPSLLVGVKTTRRSVQTGIAGDDLTEITSGLSVGDRVVTETITPVVAAPNSPFSGGNKQGNTNNRGGR